MRGAISTFAIAGTAVALLLALMGCTGGDVPPVTPAPSVDASRPPSPPAAPSLGVVRLGTTKLTLVASNGTTLATIPTSASPVDAVAELTKALGRAPKVTETTPNYCYASYTIEDWGGFSLYHGASYPLPAGVAFGFSSSRPIVGNGVRVEGPGGVAVGESASALLAGTSSTDIDRALNKGVESASVWLDLQPGSMPGDQVGTRVFVETVAGSAPATAISGPDFRLGEC